MAVLRISMSYFPGTGLKVFVRCGGGWVVWWFKPIIVFSLVQAEQFENYWLLKYID